MNKTLTEEIISKIQSWEGFENFDGTDIEFNSEDPEIFSDCEISVLMKAIEKDNIEIVKALCESGVNVNRVAKGTDQVPLTCFEEESKNSYEISKHLINSGADVNYYKKIEDFIFEEMEIFSSPLTVACNLGNYNHIKYLIESGANINFSTKTNGTTALCSVNSESKDYLKILELFISKGADVNADSGQPLIIAVESSNLDAIGLLLNAGAEPNISSKSKIGNGKTAIMTLLAGHCEDFTENEEEQLFEALFESCDNINEQDTEGQSILFYSIDTHIGSEGYDLRCFSYIINHKKIDVNVIDKNGNNALTKVMLEIEEWNSSDEEYFDDEDRFRITELINKGADYSQENTDGKTPKSIAKNIGNPKMIKLFTSDMEKGFANIDKIMSDAKNSEYNDINEENYQSINHLNSHYKRVVEIIRQIKYDNINIPKSISELPELDDYGNFDEIISQINSGELRLSIPNFKLFGSHDFVIPKKEKNISSIYLFLPYLLAIVISIFGISIGNYWLLLSIPIAFATPIMYGLFSGLIANLVLVGLVSYFLYTDRITLALVCLIILVSTMCAKLLKIRRRKTLIEIAKSNEEIFSFLFHNRTIAFVDQINGGLIYSRE